ncbi:hypothetical protein DSO57_1033796 [Entomophthora muscae]|uniref:Uncharacterized protein n=1 Tax=Entomophthora muscae TaxID=34485 RepID=A0ACC2REU3_9FUNG|nr:hypothetical protein DSO57_1033796 [Entomophthora muscae]
MGTNWRAAFACNIKHCPKLASFEIGQNVLVSRACTSGRPHKLVPIFSGPFVVIEKSSFDAYTVQHIGSGQTYQRVNAKFMKAAPVVDKESPCPLPTSAYMNTPQ